MTVHGDVHFLGLLAGDRLCIIRRICTCVLNSLALSLILVQSLLDLVLSIVVTKKSHAVRYSVIFYLIKLILVQNQCMWLAVDANDVVRLGLMLFIELLIKHIVFLSCIADMDCIFFIIIKHWVHWVLRVLVVAHKPSVKHGSTVFFVSLTETGVLVQLSKNLIESRYVWSLLQLDLPMLKLRHLLWPIR